MLAGKHQADLWKAERKRKMSNCSKRQLDAVDGVLKKWCRTSSNAIVAAQPRSGWFAKQIFYLQSRKLFDGRQEACCNWMEYSKSTEYCYEIWKKKRNIIVMATFKSGVSEFMILTWYTNYRKWQEGRNLKYIYKIVFIRLLLLRTDSSLEGSNIHSLRTSVCKLWFSINLIPNKERLCFRLAWKSSYNPPDNTFFLYFLFCRQPIVQNKINIFLIIFWFLFYR